MVKCVVFPVTNQWSISAIQVVYQWKSAVKFGGMTSFISVVYQCNISGITTRLSECKI